MLVYVAEFTRAFANRLLTRCMLHSPCCVGHHLVMIMSVVCTNDEEAVRVELCFYQLMVPQTVALFLQSGFHPACLLDGRLGKAIILLIAGVALMISTACVIE